MLAACWLAVAVVAAARAARSRADWWLVVATALALASLKQWRWHVDVYQAGRQLLREFDVYSDRGLFKLLFLVLMMLAVIAVLVLGFRSWSRASRGWKVVSVALLVQALFYAILVFSLTDWFPPALFEPPGRTVFEYACVAVAVVGCLLPGKVPVDA